MNTPNIIIQIKNSYNAMNPAMQLIADYLVANYEKTTFMRIHDLASHCGVSAASVTGFVKEMGYKNYKAFQLDMAVSLGQNSSKEEEQETPFFYGGVTEKDDISEICKKVFHTNIQMLMDTLKIIDAKQIQTVGEHILKANRLFLLGVGRSFLTAESGKSRFYRMGMNCFCFRDPHEQIVGASMCDENDVVIAISNYGRSKSVIEAVKLAKERGAVTVGISGTQNSPLVRCVDYPFISVSNQFRAESKLSLFEPSSESVAQIALLDCLYMYVAVHRSDEISEKYRATTKALEVERV